MWQGKMSRLLFSVWLLMLCMSAQPQVVVKRCKTCKKTIAQCRYKGRHPNEVTLSPPASNQQPARIIETSPSLPDVLQQLERDMVFVEGGTFTMGATAEQVSDAFVDEKSAHEVTLSSFRICKHEVTQAEWETVMGTNPSEFKGANRPVEQVSWGDCQTFIRKLNALTGKAYRLPTEAEWEYAARGGKKSCGYRYSGSSAIRIVAWFYENSFRTGKSSPDYGTHAVMTKLTNELGLYDMSGNVWEWCSDWYGGYSSSSQTNPKGPSSGSNRVRRGGSWYNDAGDCRVSNRDWFTPDDRRSNLGLRLAL